MGSVKQHEHRETDLLQIRQAPTPRDAFDIARQNEQFKRRDWEDVKEQIMMNALRHKFTQVCTQYFVRADLWQHYRLWDLLVNKTEGKELVEASPYDAYWGFGPDMRGKNRLGVLLQLLRDEIRNSPPAQVRSNVRNDHIVEMYAGHTFSRNTATASV